MKKVLVTCMILFAAISSSFAYNNMKTIYLTENGQQTVTAAIFATTEISYFCTWQGNSSGWSYIRERESPYDMIDTYVYFGQSSGDNPSYSATHTGTYQSVDLFFVFSGATGSWGLAGIEW